MRYYKYIKIILILIPILILGILIYKDFNPTGYLEVSYDFCQSTPFISKLSPYGRVLNIQKDRGECTQLMVIDPVYFDVRLPQRFDQAKLKIWYQKSVDTPLKIGVAQDTRTWQWQLRDIVYRRSINGWQLGSAAYDLSAVALDKNNLRFMISSPQLDKHHQSIVFKRIEIEFFTTPLSQRNFWPRFKACLKMTNLYFLLKF